MRKDYLYLDPSVRAVMRRLQEVTTLQATLGDVVDLLGRAVHGPTSSDEVDLGAPPTRARIADVYRLLGMANLTAGEALGLCQATVEILNVAVSVANRAVGELSREAVRAIADVHEVPGPKE